MKIKISEIKVGDNRREIDEPNVSQLKESILTIGLINPITVTKENKLIAGAHRLEACKRLGWSEIECNIVGIDGLKAELAEIDENLIRHNLDYMDEGEQLARRKEIYEVLYPQTKHGGDRKSEETKRRNPPLDFKPSFSADTSAKTGMSERTIREKIQVAQKLTPEAKAVVKEKGISKSDAIKITQVEPARQKEAAEKLANHEIKTVDEMIAPKSKPIPEVGNKQNPERKITTKEIIEQLHNPDGSPEFTIENLVDEIEINGEEYVHSLKHSIADRSTLLSTQKNRQMVLEALNGIKSQIEKLKEIIK